jgi:hypothetical protein
MSASFVDLDLEHDRCTVFSNFLDKMGSGLSVSEFPCECCSDALIAKCAKVKLIHVKFVHDNKNKTVFLGALV